MADMHAEYIHLTVALDLDKCLLDAAFTHADRFNLGTE